VPDQSAEAIISSHLLSLIQAEFVHHPHRSLSYTNWQVNLKKIGDYPFKDCLNIYLPNIAGFFRYGEFFIKKLFDELCSYLIVMLSNFQTKILAVRMNHEPDMTIITQLNFNKG
jgi:hypothetical protein